MKLEEILKDENMSITIDTHCREYDIYVDIDDEEIIITIPRTKIIEFIMGCEEITTLWKATQNMNNINGRADLKTP
jgi:uncharacterized protein (DUF169 family)